MLPTYLLCSQVLGSFWPKIWEHNWLKDTFLSPHYLGALEYIWEHEKKFGSTLAHLMHVLHFFLVCSQTLTIFPKNCQNTHFVAVLKRSPSRFSVFEGTKYRQIGWCSHMFIMLQTHFSCSQVSTAILPYFGSVITHFGAWCHSLHLSSQFFIMLQNFLSRSHVFECFLGNFTHMLGA